MEETRKMRAAMGAAFAPRNVWTAFAATEGASGYAVELEAGDLPERAAHTGRPRSPTDRSPARATCRRRWRAAGCAPVSALRSRPWAGTASRCRPTAPRTARRRTRSGRRPCPGGHVRLPQSARRAEKNTPPATARMEMTLAAVRRVCTRPPSSTPAQLMSANRAMTPTAMTCLIPSWNV